MPTRSAAFYWEYIAKKGDKGYYASIHNPYEKKVVEGSGLKGLRALTPQGELLPEIQEILGIIADASLMLGTGHLNPADEQKVLLEEAINAGVKKITIIPILRKPKRLGLKRPIKSEEITKAAAKSNNGQVIGVDTRRHCRRKLMDTNQATAAA